MEKRVSKKQSKNTVEARFKKLLKYNKPLYTSAHTIILSCKQALDLMKDDPIVAGDESISEVYKYFNALLSIKANFTKITQTKDEGYVFALSAVVSMLPLHIIASFNDVLYEYVNETLSNSTNTMAQKYCVVILQLLLQAKSKEQWQSDEDTLKLFIRLYLLACFNAKDLVRKQAIRSFTLVCKGKDLSYFSIALKRLEEAIFKDLEQCIVKVTARSINILNFLSCILQVLPVSTASNIVKKLLDFADIDNALFKKNLYFTIEIMFAATRLSSAFVQDFLNFLLEHQPVTTNIQSMNNDEELMIVGYCLAVSQVAVHYKNLEGDRIMHYLPTLLSLLTEYLTFGNFRVQSGAFNAIKNLMQYTLQHDYFLKTEFSDDGAIEGLNLNLLSLNSKFNDRDDSADEDVGQLAEEYKHMHPIKKIVKVLQYCLKSRFESSYSEVLKLVTKLLDIGGKELLNYDGIELLNNVGHLSIKKEGYKTWTKCLGTFMQKFGCETFFKDSEIKLQILDYDLTSQSFSVESRSYLITVIKNHVVNQPLSFYVDNFLPLISELSKAMSVVKKDKEFIKQKKYETLIYQIYEVLPNFCSSSVDFGTCVPKILPKLTNLIQNNTYQARSVALKALCTLIDFAKNAPKNDLEVKKGRIQLIKKAIGLLKILSEMYVDTGSTEVNLNVVVKEGEHYNILKTISKLGWIAKKATLNALFFEELGEVLEEFTELDELSGADKMDVDKQHDNDLSALQRNRKRQVQYKLDVIICLMERIKLTKKNCSIIIKFADSISKSPMAQKKAFKILSVILKNYELQTYEELQELFGQLTGYAHNPHQQKQKLTMLKIFLSKIKKEDSKEEEMKDDAGSNDSDEDDEETGTIDINDEQRTEIISTVLPEIIAGYSSHQLKSQRLSEYLLIDLVKIYRNHFNEFLKKLLAGLAGETVETRAATILILTKILKTNKKDFSDENLVKISNIVILFLKEKSVYIQRVTLKVLKRLTSILPEVNLEELCSKIIDAAVNCEAKKKLNLRIKYVISNCIRRLSKERVKKCTSIEHHPLIEYCHKMKRREENEKKLVMQQLQNNKEEAKRQREKENLDRLKEGEQFSDVSDSDVEPVSDDSSDDEQLKDKHITAYGDIPIVRNLKVITPDPDEQMEDEEEKAVSKVKKDKAKIDKMMEIDDHNLATHFYDNPVLMVKKRQEQRKKLQQLKDKHQIDDTDDLYYESKNRKFYVKDLEKVDREVNVAQKRKREERDEFLQKMLPQEVKHLIDLEDKIKGSHKRRKMLDEEFGEESKEIQLPGKNKIRGKSKVSEGHYIKRSADFYKGKDGKSDVLKKGEHEPYAYIKLNPQMINKKYRNRAVKTFESVVQKKKSDKRKR